MIVFDYVALYYKQASTGSEICQSSISGVKGLLFSQVINRV